MKLKHHWGRLAVAGLLIGSAAACGDDDPNPIAPPTIGAALVTGTISQDRTLRSDTVYTLQGAVRVESGATLTIEPGTVIQGDADVSPTFLLIQQGGMINAVGTADRPIVFTSSRPAGQRRRGDWGGVVLNGRAPCNFGPTCEGEGPVGTYGGDQPNDNSGHLSYVRIEYVGQVFTADNELNGLTLNGVGSGTQIDHIQVHYGLDDGIEFFGGNVNVKYAIVTGAEDDSFDYSTGWQGKGQFWLAQQDPQIGDKGFEVDGNEDVFTAEPVTNPQIYNVTLIGKGPGGNTSSEVSGSGVQLRRGTAGKVYNGIVLGFITGLDIDDAATVDHCLNGTLMMANTIFSDLSGQLLDSDDDDKSTDGDQQYESTCTAQSGWTAIEQISGPVLADPYSQSAPDFRPVSGSAALSTAVATPPNDGFFTTDVDYLGAVAPSGTPWYQGWITTAVN